MHDNKNLDNKVVRDFKLTTLALKNKNTIFLLAISIMVFGFISYNNLPKELFPEVVFPKIMVQTVYPGNSPIDMENLVTRPIEKEIEGLRGVTEITSSSTQGVSLINIEFNFDVDINDALNDVKDAVDKAQSELPTDVLLQDPVVKDIDMTEFPIININLSGDYSIFELKKYAEYLEDEIEGLSEISKVEIKGVNDREILVDIDKHKLEAFELSLWDIENAIANENVSLSGGEIKHQNTKRSVRILGEFTSIKEMESIVVKHENDKIVYLRDLAKITDGFADPTSFTRLDSKPVVSLQVIKKSGENLLSATDQIFDILDLAKENNHIPQDLTIAVTNDQSDMIRKQLNNLENSMIMGVLFVVIVLFFFLGTRNAIFVGIAIPLSMFLSFVVLGFQDAKINMIVLFALILALGMLVDNAIVVVENIYRFIDRGYSLFEAARQAVGEIALPIITSTATTLAAFLPLAFWDSMVGEFMKYLPITLIIVLTSSLFVALVIIPVFSSSFIRKDGKHGTLNKKRGYRTAAIMLIIAIPLYFLGINGPANLLMLGVIITVLNILIIHRAGLWFQNVFLVKLENGYLKLIQFSLKRNNPIYMFVSMLVLLIASFIIFGKSNPKILFFPDNDPKYINIITELPIGTNIDSTNIFMKSIEKKVQKVLQPYNDVVESIMTTVGDGARGENEFFLLTTDNRGLITITFCDFQDRQGVNTSDIQKVISKEFLGKYPGISFRIEKNKMGPPTGKPISLEIIGKEFDELANISDSILTIIENSSIKGIEGMQLDVDLGKPEILFHIDRTKARRFGLSTQQIAGTIRTALFGKEVSDFKDGEEEYPIHMRLRKEDRNSVSSLLNQKITYRNNRGKIMQVPISSVTTISYSSTYSAVQRKDLERVFTLSSNVIEGYNANEINQSLKELLKTIQLPDGYKYNFGGEQEDMAESSSFLIKALAIAISLILIILVTQFNSLAKPIIIITSVLFSTIGVLLGLSIFKMDFIIVMTGIGIVSLAGVVVNNAIVLIDYITLLKNRKRKELGLEENAILPLEVSTECIVQAGKTRLRPVLLTAITTILGLIPMAIGLNIDFQTMLTEFNPQLYMGGDMVHFWGPISWTVIFGLTFATFLTLVIVPVMYRLANSIQKSFIQKA